MRLISTTMLNKATPRLWYLLVFSSCAMLLAFALYYQYVDYLDPCPLCIFQRLAFFWMGSFALLAALHNPARLGQRTYAWLVAAGALFGAAVAGRHIWLQHLPSSEVPECGPGLNYMLENFPLMHVLETVLQGSGSCAEVKWSFVGLSMPMWTFVWYTGLGLVTLWLIYRLTRQTATSV